MYRLLRLPLFPTWHYFLWNLTSRSPGVQHQGEASTGCRCPLYDGGADDTSEPLFGTINFKIIPDRSANVTTSFRSHLIWLDRLLGMAGIVERLVPDELWELFQR
ncbi:hypothetical protein ACWEQO_34705, partial [Streptomyces sp. NPDC004051]